MFRLGGWSPQLPTGFLVSRGTLDTACCLNFSLTRLSRSSVGLPMPFSKILTIHYAVHNPEDIATFGLAFSAFARHYLRNLFWFLFLALLRCFSSGGSPPMPILFNIGWQSIALPGFPIRKSRDQNLCAVPPSLSQLATSFIGSWCQGIPLALLLAWP